MVALEYLSRPPPYGAYLRPVGLLAEARCQRPLALQRNIRCVTSFDEFPSSMTGSGPTALVRLTRQLSTSAPEQVWQHMTGQPVRQAIRDYISHRNEGPGGEV